MAIAIITRCAMPPDSWCGKASSRAAASGISTCSIRLKRARPAGRTIPSLVVAAVDAQRLHQLERDGEAGIEARERILEDHRDVLADQRAPFALGNRREVATAEHHGLRVHPPGKVDESHQRQRGHRLAGTGFPDDAHDFARIDGEVEAVDRPKRRTLGAEFDGQAGDVEECHSGSIA